MTWSLLIINGISPGHHSCLASNATLQPAWSHWIHVNHRRSKRGLLVSLQCSWWSLPIRESLAWRVQPQISSSTGDSRGPRENLQLTDGTPKFLEKSTDSVRRFLDIDVEGTWISKVFSCRYFALLFDCRYYDVLMIYMSKRQKGSIAELRVSRYSTVWHSM